MATSPETIRYIQGALRSSRFQAKAMFGEYALYADGKVVALVCDDRVFVKVHGATIALADCEQEPPYPGAKPHYVVEEGRLADPAFAKMLLTFAKDQPEPKRRPKPASTSSKSHTVANGKNSTRAPRKTPASRKRVARRAR